MQNDEDNFGYINMHSFFNGIFKRLYLDLQVQNKSGKHRAQAEADSTGSKSEHMQRGHKHPDPFLLNSVPTREVSEKPCQRTAKSYEL